MPDELTDQLRRYGEALEQSVLAVEREPVVVRTPWWSRHRGLLGVAACVVVLAGGAALVAVQNGRRPADITTTGPTSLVPSTATSATTATTVASTDTTRVPPRVVRIEGTATWVGGPDPRATLRIGACPAGEQQQCTASPWVLADPDGSFTLPIPTDNAASDEWVVAAYVTVLDDGCIFDCVWRTAQVGPSTTVSVSQPPQSPLQLSVAARVVDVYVYDRDGHPFEGGGVLVDDQRCAAERCQGEFGSLFFRTSSADGAARLIVDPSVTYEFHGQAMDTRWANPEFIVDGSTFWTSPNVTALGSDLEEGHAFLVNGGP